MSPATVAAESTALAPLAPSDPMIISLRERAQAIAAEGEALQVVDEDAKVRAVEILGGIARVTREAEKKRDELVRPHNTWVTGVNRIFKDVLAPIVKLDETLRKRCRDFDREQAAKAAAAAAVADRERLAAEARLTEAAEAEKRGDTAVAEQLLEKAVESEQTARTVQAEAVLPTRSVKTEVASAHTVGRWTFEVLDVTKVPPQFLEVNGVAVRKEINAGAREIPGLRIFKDTSLAVKG